MPKKKKKKGNTKKRKGWFAGIGSVGTSLYKVGQIGEIQDAKGDAMESTKQAVISVVTGVAGVIAGSAVGKMSGVAGLATAFAGAYTGSMPLVTFGVGMLGGGNRKLTPAQEAEINAKYPDDKQYWSKQTAIAKASASNSLSELKEKTFLGSKTETKVPTTDDQTAQKGLGYAGRRVNMSVHSLGSTERYLHSDKPKSSFNIYGA